jgi:NAD(P)-dependent dehydrogenase (short-subunit alcohol dehydrogenase family)
MKTDEGSLHQVNLFSLQGKTALVTGGSGGIGRMASIGLMRAGASVLIASRKGDMCIAAAAELNALGLPGSATGFGGDVSTEEGVLALAEAVKERTDVLHILVNNAGIAWAVVNEDFPFNAWSKVMNVNNAGLFTLTQKLLPLMIESSTKDDPARVVNVGSVMGTVPLAEGTYAYAASKAAVHHITKFMAAEYAAKHVTFNAIAPGPFASKMTAFATSDEGNREKIGAAIPLGRMGRDDDIAGCLQFLCGRAGSYITGAILPVCGGVHVQSPPNVLHLPSLN